MVPTKIKLSALLSSRARQQQKKPFGGRVFVYHLSTAAVQNTTVTALRLLIALPRSLLCPNLGSIAAGVG